MIALEKMGLESLKNATYFYLPIEEDNADYELEKFCKIVYGITNGWTLYKNVKGAWRGEKIDYEEEINVLEVCSDINLLNQFKIIEAFKDFGINTKQELMSINFNGKLHFYPLNLQSPALPS